MLSFVSTAATGTDAAAGGLFGGPYMIIMLVLFIAIFYFMILRPENKKKKEQENLRNSLHRGDKITTIGGIMGKIVDIKDDKIVIESGEDQVRLELQKWSVMTNNTAEKEKSKKSRGSRRPRPHRKTEGGTANSK